MRQFTPGFFRRRVEGVLAHCDEVLAEHDWVREENGKRRFPHDRDCEPFSDLWYAGLIGELCWRFLNYREFSNGEAGLQQAMSIGVRYTEWEWRAKYRRNIVRGAKNLKASQQGGAIRAGVLDEETRRIIAEMRRLRAEGHTIKGAAEAAARRGVGTSGPANRAAWYRLERRKL
jgi:hypothetical protein